MQCGEGAASRPAGRWMRPGGGSWLAATAASLILAGPVEAQPRQPRSPEADEKEIRRLEAEITDTVALQDPEAYERLLADDYTTVGVRGLLRTKAEVVEDARRRSGRTDSVSQAEIRVSLCGDAAVVRAVRTTVGSSLRGQDVSGRSRTLRVYVFRDGRWQAVAFQMTRIFD